MRKIIVLKVGGSLIDEVGGLLGSLKELDVKDDLNLVIVPGGGVFADTVREHASNLSDDAAHTMAIFAMDQYGTYIADRCKIRVIDRLEEIGESRGLSVLLLSRIMRERDPLPHTWDVTSDTIAAWVASKVGARFIKMTDVDGVFQEDKLLAKVSAHDLKRFGSSCTDRALPDFLIAHKMDCAVINGRCPQCLKGAIDERAFKGTLIKGVC